MKPIVGSFTEPQVDRRKVLVGLLFCSAAGLAAWRQPAKHVDYLGKQKLEDVVPKTLGPWNFVAASGLVVPPEDQLSQAIYSQLLTRVYSDGNSQIMLLIAQSGSQTGVLQIHRPEICYAANGFRIAELSPRHIQLPGSLLTASSLGATADDRTEYITYWTRVGDRMPLSWKQQRWAVAEQNIRGVLPDAILIRVSMVSNDGQAATATIDSFIRDFIGAIPANRRAIFIA